MSGVSNYGEHHLDELLASATISPSINQIELSPFNQRRNLLAYCAERSIPVQAWGSLTAGQQLRPPKSAPWPGYAKEKARTDEDGTSPVLVQVAREAGCTVAQVLLRWGLQKGFGVLPRSRHPPHIQENWAARCALSRCRLCSASCSCTHYEQRLSCDASDVCAVQRVSYHEHAGRVVCPRLDGGLRLSDSAMERLDALDEGRVTAWNPVVAP
jgi:hypothetical protein